MSKDTPAEEVNNNKSVNKNDAVRKKAEWLKYCLDIGFIEKSQLDKLSAIWDEHKDEFGNLKPVSSPPDAGKEQDRYKEIAELISNIFYYGNFKAETANERQLEKLLTEVGLWPTSETEILSRTLYKQNK